MMLYFSIKFQENFLDSFRVILGTPFFMQIIKTRHNFLKKHRWSYNSLFFTHHVIMVNNYTKFHENIFNCVGQPFLPDLKIVYPH